APLLDVVVLDALQWRLHERIVHEDVDAAERARGEVGEGAALVVVRHVGGKVGRLAPETLDLGGHLLPPLFGPRAGDEVRTLAGERERDVTAHAGPDPGD